MIYRIDARAFISNPANEVKPEQEVAGVTGRGGRAPKRRCAARSVLSTIRITAKRVKCCWCLPAAAAIRARRIYTKCIQDAWSADCTSTTKAPIGWRFPRI